MVLCPNLTCVVDIFLSLSCANVDLVTIDVTSTTARVQWPPLSTATVSVAGYGLSYRAVMPSGLEHQGSEVAGSGAMSVVLGGLEEGVSYSFVLIPTGVSLPAIAGTRLWIEYSTMFSTLSDGEVVHVYVCNNAYVVLSYEFEIPTGTGTHTHKDA